MVKPHRVPFISVKVASEFCTRQEELERERIRKEQVRWQYGRSIQLQLLLIWGFPKWGYPKMDGLYDLY